MKDKMRELVPLRDVPLGLAHATIWFAVLWVIDHPVEEWIGIVVIAYIALWVSKAVIVKLTIALLRALRNYGLQAITRAGIGRQEQGQAQTASGASLVVILFLLSVIAAILGCALVPTTYIATAYGLTPLSSYFAVIGWTLLIAGVSALTLFFGLSFILFKTVGSFKTTGVLPKPNALNSRIIRIDQSETLVQRLAA